MEVGVATSSAVVVASGAGGGVVARPVGVAGVAGGGVEALLVGLEVFPFGFGVWTVGLVAAVVATGWLLVREARRHRGRGSDRRVRLTALPTDGFDPGVEDVERCGAQLARARGRLTRNRHQALRLRLDSIGDGGCVYRLEAPAHAAQVVRTAGYGDVELCPTDADGLDPATPTVDDDEGEEIGDG